MAPFLPERFPYQVSWFERDILHWYDPNWIPTSLTFTLVMGYDDVYDWQEVAIDGSPGTGDWALTFSLGS
jgi:hypothetical protein